MHLPDSATRFAENETRVRPRRDHTVLILLGSLFWSRDRGGIGFAVEGGWCWRRRCARHCSLKAETRHSVRHFARNQTHSTRASFKLASSPVNVTLPTLRARSRPAPRLFATHKTRHRAHLDAQQNHLLKVVVDSFPVHQLQARELVDAYPQRPIGKSEAGLGWRQRVDGDDDAGFGTRAERGGCGVGGRNGCWETEKGMRAGSEWIRSGSKPFGETWYGACAIARGLGDGVANKYRRTETALAGCGLASTRDMDLGGCGDGLVDRDGVGGRIPGSECGVPETERVGHGVVGGCLGTVRGVVLAESASGVG
uniref:Uncharacterized protein n=1 Tax=Mycena chlorophos TaxID=658473 RepID=A0ABQ0L0J9_MYCCL|nr:predicted protein [Mycena chlorophos]